MTLIHSGDYTAPPDAQTRRAFRVSMGETYADQPGEEAMRYDATLAAYASLSARANDKSGTFDPQRWEAAVYLANVGSGTEREVGLDGRTAETMSPKKVQLAANSWGRTTMTDIDGVAPAIYGDNVASAAGDLVPEVVDVPSSPRDAGASVEAKAPPSRQFPRTQEFVDKLRASAEEGRALADKEGPLIKELETMRREATKKDAPPIDGKREAQILEQLKPLQRASRVWNSQRQDLLWEVYENQGGLTSEEEEEMRNRQAMSVLPAMGAIQFGPRAAKVEGKTPPPAPKLEEKPRYKVKAMDKEYLTEDVTPHPMFGKTEPMKYFTPEERVRYKVQVKDGLLYDNTGKLLDFGPKRLFVMSGDGDIYVGPDLYGVYHHSSILAGKPVAAAGEISVENGRIIAVSKASGHYMHEDEYIRQFIKELARLGVPNARQLKIYNRLP
jgi:hypothetical protein